MTIEQRLNNIESRLDSLQESFIQAQKNNVIVTSHADTGNAAAPQVSVNTSDISDNSDAIFELAEMIAEMEAQNG